MPKKNSKTANENSKDKVKHNATSVSKKESQKQSKGQSAKTGKFVTKGNAKRNSGTTTSQNYISKPNIPGQRPPTEKK